jgi:hypothetical protein
MQGLWEEFQSLQEVQVKLTKILTKNLTYWNQLLEMKDQISAITLVYEQLQMDDEALLPKYQKE